MYSINLTRSHEIFSFCEQTLKMAANDASGQGLQSALRNKHQNIFWESYEPKTYFLISHFHVTYSFSIYELHTILKTAQPRWTIIIFIFIYRPWKWTQMTRLVKGYNMHSRTGTNINFRESYMYDELTPVFDPKPRHLVPPSYILYWKSPIKVYTGFPA